MLCAKGLTNWDQFTVFIKLLNDSFEGRWAHKAIPWSEHTNQDGREHGILSCLSRQEEWWATLQQVGDRVYTKFHIRFNILYRWTQIRDRSYLCPINNHRQCTIVSHHSLSWNYKRQLLLGWKPYLVIEMCYYWTFLMAAESQFCAWSSFMSHLTLADMNLT